MCGDDDDCGCDDGGGLVGCGRAVTRCKRRLATGGLRLCECALRILLLCTQLRGAEGCAPCLRRVGCPLRGESGPGEFLAACRVQPCCCALASEADLDTRERTRLVTFCTRKETEISVTPAGEDRRRFRGTPGFDC